MKKLLLAGVVAIAGLTASAQNVVVDNPDNHPYFGARVALDINSYSGKGFSNGAGFSIGGVYNAPLYKNLYFEPGLSLFYNTVGVKHADMSVKNLGFRIPLNFGYHFDVADDLSIHVFTGPQVNFNILARFDGESLFDDGYKRFDMQWNFGVGVGYQQYYASIGGGVGMTNVTKGVDRSIVSITLGYNF